MYTRILIAFLISCLSTPLLIAQEKKPALPLDYSRLPQLPPAKEGDRVCRCISTFIPEKKEYFYLKIDSTYHIVALNGEGISIPFPVRGAPIFKLYTKTANEKGEDIYEPVVEQTLTGAGGKFIITLQRAKGEKKMKSTAYNINKTNYPANSLYLFNESTATLGLVIQENKAVVKPFKAYTYSYKDAGRNTYTSAKIVMRYNGENKIMSSKRLRLVPDRRIMLFCLQSKTREELGATPLKVITLQDKP